MFKHILQSDALYDYLCKVSLRETAEQSTLRQMTNQTVRQSFMMTSPEQAQFLQMQMRLINAKRAIEVGVFTGYGTLAMALALPNNGELIACDVDGKTAGLGQPYWQQAGVAQKIQLTIAPAIDTLEALIASGQQKQFDFMFVDADKGNYLNYYELGLALIRPGGLMVFDNVLSTYDDLVMDQVSRSGKALYQFNERLCGDQRVSISLVPIGSGMLLTMCQ